MRVEGAAVVFAAGLWLTAGLAAAAQDLGTPDLAPPTPRIVIYPGDIIADDMLSDLPADTARGVGPFAETRVGGDRQDGATHAAAGRRRFRSPRSTFRALSSTAAEVNLVFIDGGLSISAVGIGAAGRRGGRLGQGAQRRQRRHGHRRRPAGRRGAGERRLMRRLLIALLVCALVGPAAAAVRIKDITALRGARDSQLIGYGLVIGLAGTGDSLRNAPFTQQALSAMLDRMGINVRGSTLRNRNVAAVIVTADLPSGMDVGSRLDVTVSALGDSTSLMGGTLLLTQLSATDGLVYADAQGAVSVTGFDVAGQAQTLSQGVPTAGQIPNGAIIQRAVPPPPDELRMILELKNPDYTTAVRIVDAVNAYSQRRFRRRSAFEATQPDRRTVPAAGDQRHPLHGGDRRIAGRAGHRRARRHRFAHRHRGHRPGRADLDGRGHPRHAVGAGSPRPRPTSQPAPFSQGKTVEQPRTKIDAQQDGGQVAIVSGSSLRALVNGLNRIGVKPSGIIAILQAIKTAGALQADLVVQ